MKYYALEGIDNCGKSTIIKKLKEDFPNFNYVREPGTTTFAEQLRQVAFSNLNADPVAIQVALLSARIDLSSQLLAKNQDTISDRCYLSLAYVDGFEKEICDKLLSTNRLLVPLLPKKIIYLYVSPEESVKRFKNKTMEGYDTINVEDIKRRLDRYDYLLDRVKELSISEVVRVNAERDFSLVYNDIKDIVYGEKR